MFNVLRNWRGVPSKEWLKDLGTPNNTPDLFRLEHSEFHRLFEYGEMKKDMPKHTVLHVDPICTAYTVEKLPLWTHNQGEGTIPFAARINLPSLIVPRPKVCGELYQITKDKLIELDNLRLNGVSFERKRVKLIVPFLDPEGDPIECRAWMYVGKKKYWEPMIQWDQDFYLTRTTDVG
jgi:gamma-glutamylcyclotransferase (GGCT)/AIG2-like uncharacterized protein YtfP